VRAGFALLIGLIALFAIAKVVVYDSLDPDCFWHLKVAAQLQHDGIGPIVDHLSYASNPKPWTPYSWLAELGMKAIWDLGGFRAAVAVTAIAEASILILLAMCCLQLQRTPAYLPAILATGIGAFFILPYLSFRPVTFAFVILFAIAFLLLRDQRLGKSKSIWLAVPLTMVLTNIHLFSFFVPAMFTAMAMGELISIVMPRQNATDISPSPGTPGEGRGEGDFERNAALDIPNHPHPNPLPEYRERGLDAIRRRFRRYTVLASMTLLACLATPMLPGLLHTVFFYSAQDRMVKGPVIVEMQSFFRGVPGMIAGVICLGMLACVARRYRAIPIGQLICIAVTGLLLMKLGRFAPIFALAICPALAATLPGLRDRLLGKPAILALLALVLLMGSVRVASEFPRSTTTLSAWVNRHGPDTPGYPCDAADYIARNVAPSNGKLINEFSWGGYLAWRLGNQYQVLLDGRTQVYPAALWQATYLGNEEERRRFLGTLHADAAVVPAGRSWFRPTLIQLGWRSVYTDADHRAEVLLPPDAVAHSE
jgi:hypothetical protein